MNDERFKPEPPPEPPRPSAVVHVLAEVLVELEKATDPDTSAAACIWLAAKVQREVEADPARRRRVEAVLGELVELERQTAQRHGGEA